RQTIPRRDAHINALLKRLVAQVLAPIPRADVARERIRKRIDAKGRMRFVETAEDDRAEVALRQPAAAREFDGGGAQLVERDAVLHAINLRRAQQPLHMFAQAEDGGAAFRVVTTDAFKDT